MTFIKPPPSPSLLQLQREASPEASRVHLPPGEAAKLGGELLRGPLCHPDTGPAQNGNCHPQREEMICGIYRTYCVFFYSLHHLLYFCSLVVTVPLHLLLIQSFTDDVAVKRFFLHLHCQSFCFFTSQHASAYDQCKHPDAVARVTDHLHPLLLRFLLLHLNS